jgi:hypothetical protein
VDSQLEKLLRRWPLRRERSIRNIGRVAQQRTDAKMRPSEAATKAEKIAPGGQNNEPDRGAAFVKYCGLPRGAGNRPGSCDNVSQIPAARCRQDLIQDPALDRLTDVIRLRRRSAIE